MGIDIYARWRTQTEEEKAAQITGFSTVHGHVGYLREAYHGEPYATRFLVREAFESKTHEAQIPSALLRKRLLETLKLVEERELKLYGTHWLDLIPVIESYKNFVALCREKEAETGEPCTIRAHF